MRYNSPFQPRQKRETPLTTRPVDPRRLRLRMVREQLQGRGITDPGVLDAMSRVPRHLFVPEAFAAHAYNDSPLPIGQGQTISQPYMVARMTQFLEARQGMRVLEIGVGSGYQAAVLAAMGCIVFGMERVKEIYQATSARLRRMGLGAIHIQRGDGTLGLPQAAPFDRIIVSAGGPKIPDPLISQLAVNGVMLIPVGGKPRAQRLLRLRKRLGSITTEDLGAAVFVDLVGHHGWKSTVAHTSNRGF